MKTREKAGRNGCYGCSNGPVKRISVTLTSNYGSSITLWQQHNHPMELSINQMMDQRLDYIHNNPVEAGFVDDPAAWEWSSCSDYERGVEGKLKLEFIA